jgi:hypothetical protein
MSYYESLHHDSERQPSQRDQPEISLPGYAETWQLSLLDFHSNPYLKSLAVTISNFDYPTAIFWGFELALLYNQA